MAFSIDNNAEKLKGYLLAQGYLQPDEPVVISQLGGGISCDVFKVESSKGAVVFKQALAKLRVKDDWFINPERSNAEKDCLKLVAAGADANRPRGTVADFMTTAVTTISPDTDVYYAAGLFLHQGFRRFPVVEAGKLVGAITRFDILRVIHANLR